MARRSRELTWPRDGQTAKASGTLEVCALVFMVFVTSRFGWGLLALVAISTGAIETDMLTTLLGGFLKE